MFLAFCHRLNEIIVTECSLWLTKIKGKGVDMKINRFFSFLFMLMLAGALLIPSVACQQASVEDIKGLLQAVEGKEMVIKLDDGTIARITVQDDKATAEVKQLVGKHVDASVRIENGERQLEKVEKRAMLEDQKSNGTIESINANMARIGGRDFKITATTELDGGLIAGAAARVEFITLADGTMIATQIETDKRISRGRGEIESISDDKLVVNGEAFHMDDTTRRNNGLAAGQQAHIEFVDDNGVKHVTELEQQVENNHFMGTIQAMTANSITVDGRTFMINAATMLDNGLAVGAMARLEFITMANGDYVATEIENDEAELEIEIENEVEHGVEIENEVENEVEDGVEVEAGDDNGGSSGKGN